MTREEILKDDWVANHYGDRVRNWVDPAFIAGAEWMQEKMIEKATQFIYDTIFGWTGGSVTKTWNQCRDEYVERLNKQCKMKASDWNRIEAGVPKEGQLCLIRLKGSQIAVSAFEIVLDDKGGEFGAFAVDGSYYTIDFITHYMPIVPPKED